MVLSTAQKGHHLTPHLVLVEKSAEDILRAADRAEPELRRATLAAYSELQKQIPDLDRLIASGDTAAVMDAVRTAQVPPSMVNRIVDATVTAAVASGMPEAARFALSFNAPNEEVIRWAKLNAARNITSGAVDLATQAAIRDVMVNALETGVHPRVTANILKGMVPLDGQQAGNIKNWVKGATEAGLSQSHIDRVVARKTARAKRYRAIRIARTETIKASNMGQQAVWNHAKDSGLLPDGTRKVWVASGDDRTCPICAVMNGQTVEVSGNFSVTEQATGFQRVGSSKEVTDSTFRVTGTKPLKRPSSPKTPPAHPQCRCTIVLETIPVGRQTGTPTSAAPQSLYPDPGEATDSPVFNDMRTAASRIRKPKQRQALLDAVDIFEDSVKSHPDGKVYMARLNRMNDRGTVAIKLKSTNTGSRAGFYQPPRDLDAPTQLVINAETYGTVMAPGEIANTMAHELAHAMADQIGAGRQIVVSFGRAEARTLSSKVAKPHQLKMKAISMDVDHPYRARMAYGASDPDECLAELIGMELTGAPPRVYARGLPSEYVNPGIDRDILADQFPDFSNFARKWIRGDYDNYDT